MVFACVSAFAANQPTKAVGAAPVAAKPAASASTAAATPKLADVYPGLADRYRKIVSLIDQNRVREAITTLSSEQSRVAGYPGADHAADYVQRQFRQIGLEDVRAEQFGVTVPVDQGASIEVAGRKFPVHALWPNLVRTSQLPPEGVRCNLIYAGKADLPAFNGKKVDGSGALIDFNSGTDWLNAPRLGAKLVIFVQPDSTMRGEAEAKFSAVPVSIPRFWISRSDADAIRKLIDSGQATDALVKCDMPWERRPAQNIIAKIEGTDPELKKQIIVIHSYYDSMSVVPSLSPGAETTCGMAAMFELARIMKQMPPKRTVWFVTTSGHFTSLAGMRSYIDRHLTEYAQPGTLDGIKRWMNKTWPAGTKRFGINAVPALLAVVGLWVIVVLWRRVRNRVKGPLRLTPFALGLLVVFAWIPANAAFVRGFNYSVPNPPNIYLFVGLDLSSQTQGVGVFYKGYFYDGREDVASKMSDLAGDCRLNSERVAQVFGFEAQKDARFADAVNQIGGKLWRNYVPGKLAIDTEPVVLAGMYGISFVSVNDSRPRVDTPFDTPDHINYENLMKQVQMVACLTDHIVRDPNEASGASVTMPDGTKVENKLRMAILNPGTFSRMTLTGGFAELSGQAVEFDPKKSFVPNTPVQDSLAVVRSPHKSFMGVRANIIEATEDFGKSEEWRRAHPGLLGRFRFPGMSPVTGFQVNKVTSIGAYKIDPRSGEIVNAPDQGVYGAFYPTDITITSGSKETPVILFPCVTSSIYDLIDPQGMQALSTLDIYEATTNGNPRMFGYALAVPEPQNPHVENMAVIFSQPNARLKLILGAGPAATRLVLINSELEEKNGALDQTKAEGVGYDTGSGITFKNTALRAAIDMWNLDEFRTRRLQKFKIVNEGINTLHKLAKDELALAATALKQLDYGNFDSHCRAAWGYEARAYPDVQKTAKDVVNGVLFYLALMLPFAFFTERLLIGSPKLTLQLTWFFAIFLCIFGIFYLVHPAFQVTMNPTIVLLAFIMLALSSLVIFLIVGKFEEQLKTLNQQMSGVHKADIGRMSVAAAAFSLGISNMRRRKARTILTCITLVLLTFVVLSFTSIVQVMKFNKTPAKHDPGANIYQGVQIRQADWTPMQELGYQLMNDEFGSKYPVAPRAWFFGALIGDSSSLNLRRGDVTFEAKAAVGLTPREAQIMDLTGKNKPVIAAGDWFGYRNGKPFDGPQSPYEMVLPSAIATALGVTPADIGKAKVTFAGNDFTVIGILDSAKFKAITDLDSEPLTPVDFVLMSKSQGQQKGGDETGGTEYTHLEPDVCFYIPYRTLMNTGGDLRSLAVGFVTPDEVKTQLDRLMPRLGLNLYAGQGDSIYRYSSIGGTSGKGFQTVFIPILIAALIVLNTMLGSVYERVKEIGIFSSIGLAPTHIAVLFIAESLVYAILGAVAGYVLGQGASKLLTATGWLPGLYLNFSSTSAVWATLIVVAVVIGSTLYPARKASQVATPAIQRSWRVPDPVGDVWEIVLPFAVTGEQAKGVNGFLAEWFRAYEDYSVGDFVTEEVATSQVESQYGIGQRMSCKTWIAPFDLGVSQRIVLDTLPTDMEDVFEVRMIIHRDSGDVGNWKRVNRRFLNTVRKQFLIWRTLTPEDRGRYMESAEIGNREQVTGNSALVEG